MTTFILVPGLGNSLGDHWQQHWLQALPNSHWAQLGAGTGGSWDNPDRALWVARLHSCIEAVPGPRVLIGHSLGCLTIAHWAEAYPQECSNIQAAWLVALPDPQRPDFPTTITGFSKPPLSALPFPSVLVTSSNDPYCTQERSEAFVKAWGCRVQHLGDAGHINTSSGYGPWPQGRAHLKQWLEELGL
jgi:uncharacterized protein